LIKPVGNSQLFIISQGQSVGLAKFQGIVNVGQRMFRMVCIRITDYGYLVI
jgi:hypothetical protein